MKSALCVIILVLNYAYLIAQNNENRFDNFYIEAGGAGIFYSINFERAVPDSRQVGSLYTVGISPLLSFQHGDFGSDIGFSGSAQRYYNANKKSQYSFGLGASCIFIAEETLLFITAPITYKYTFSNNRVYLGFSIYGMFEVLQAQMLAFPGIKAGYNFQMKCKYCRSL